jgi:RHS repeat-associated protein
VRDVLDAQTGANISSYDFDPYGKPVGSGLPVDFGFAGMSNHQGSSLNLAMFRPYDPQSGRWMSRDPFGESIGPNLYAYAENSPIRKSDPFGLAPTGKLYAILFALAAWLDGENAIAKAIARREETNIALHTERMNKRGALSCGPPPPPGPEDVLEFIVAAPVLLVEFLLQFQTVDILRGINGEPLNQMN